MESQAANRHRIYENSARHRDFHSLFDPIFLPFSLGHIRANQELMQEMRLFVGSNSSKGRGSGVIHSSCASY